MTDTELVNDGILTTEVREQRWDEDHFLFMSDLMTLSVISDYKELNDLMIVNNALKRMWMEVAEA